MADGAPAKRARQGPPAAAAAYSSLEGLVSRSVLDQVVAHFLGASLSQEGLLNLGLSRPPVRVLLSGPRGSGKTAVALAAAEATGLRVHSYPVDCMDVGALFERASSRTERSVIVINDLDTISSELDLGLRLDSLTQSALVIAVATSLEAVEVDIRRRFNTQIPFGYPDVAERAKMLSVLTRNTNLPTGEGLDYHSIAMRTQGYVLRDLSSVVQSVKPSDLAAAITLADLEDGLRLVQPSVRAREGFSDIREVTLADVGGLALLRKAFDDHILNVIKCPEKAGADSWDGILLYGPWGCGKTFFTKAYANFLDVNFIHIKALDFLTRYEDDTSKELQKLFARARLFSPSIIFIDDLQDDGDGSVKAQLSVELGTGDLKNVFVIGAFNGFPNAHKDLLDLFGLKYYVGPPDPSDRALILKALARETSLDTDVDLNSIAMKCTNFSGDDVSRLLEKSALHAFNEKSDVIKARHFKRALRAISPTLSPEIICSFDKQARLYKFSVI